MGNQTAPSLTNAAGQGSPFGTIGSIAQGRPAVPAGPQVLYGRLPGQGNGTSVNGTSSGSGNVATAPDKGLDAGGFQAQFPMSSILASLLAGGIGGKGQQRHMGASPSFKGFEAPATRNAPQI